MDNMISFYLAALVGSKSVAALAGGFVGWLCWLRLREKRGRNSPAHQRDRIRRDYWARS